MNSTILAIVCWNCWISLAIGLFLNGILLFLIIKHSTEELRHFGKVLVYYCVVNTATLLLQTFTQPIFFTGIDGRSFIFFAGPAASVLPSPIWRHIFFSCYFSSFMLILASLTLQFLERYLVLCRSSTKHNLRRFLLSIFQKVFLIVSILLDICIYPSKEYSIGEVLPQQSLVNGMKGEGLKIAAELDLQNASTELAFAAFAISLIVAYLIIVICYSRIRKFIKRNMASSNSNGGMSISNRDSSRQIVVNMFFQALLPIYSICIYLMDFGCILGSQSLPWLVHLQMLTFVPINWLPLLNPLATMLTIRSYRNALLRMCRWRVEPSSSVNMLKQISLQDRILFAQYLCTPIFCFINSFYSFEFGANTWIRPGGWSAIGLVKMANKEFGKDQRLMQIAEKAFTRPVQRFHEMKPILREEEFVLLLAILCSSSNISGLSAHARDLLYAHQTFYSRIFLQNLQNNLGMEAGAKRFADCLFLMECAFQSAQNHDALRVYVNVFHGENHQFCLSNFPKCISNLM